MTQQEAYDDLEKTIGACFGWANREFAGHPSDQKAAEEKRTLIEANQLEESKVRTIVSGFLYKEGVTSSHLDAELAGAMEFFFPKPK